jgi:UDP-2,3-diacylglucosamine pyrophosphatase LpxH
MKVRALFISDTHLGTEFCNHEKILNLLKDLDCEYLYIVGDFLDGWALQRKFRWHNNYNTIIQKILRLSRKGTKVIYLAGNHDLFIDSFKDFRFGDNIFISRQDSHCTLKNKKFLILHGDQFDGVISKYKTVQKIGAFIYDSSLHINFLFRFFKFSFSNFLKSKAKEAIKYINNYEQTVSSYCHSKNFDGVICGHIHKPEIKKIGSIIYCNCGDFVESNSAIVEDLQGELRLIFL